jgi:hypothetical protein
MIVVNQLDIWRSAHEFMKQHGTDAAVHAAMKADKFLAAGNLDGAATWRRIVRAIRELASTEPPAGKTRN